MQSGALRQRGTIERIVKTEHTNAEGYDTGGKVNAPKTVAVVWYNDVSAYGRAGRELQEQKRLNSKLSHAIEIRYRADVLPGMRMVLENRRVLTINTATDPIHRRRSLILLCEEELARG